MEKAFPTDLVSSNETLKPFDIWSFEQIWTLVLQCLADQSITRRRPSREICWGSKMCWPMMPLFTIYSVCATHVCSTHSVCTIYNLQSVHNLQYVRISHCEHNFQCVYNLQCVYNSQCVYNLECVHNSQFTPRCAMGSWMVQLAHRAPYSS